MDEHFFRISELINKKLWGQLNAQEENELHKWEKEYPFIKKWTEITHDKKQNLKEKAIQLSKTDPHNEWTRIAKKSSTKTKTRHKYWVAAACIVTITILGLWLLPRSINFDQRMLTGENNSQKEIIAPATNKALVTLSNGEKILLEGDKDNFINDGELQLTSSGGKLNYSASDAQEVYNHTIEVPLGATFFVQLSDGTKVWLNADSKLIYPSKFHSNYRLVTVQGEAYFEVAKDSKRPFKVYVDGTEVEALGTSFNINTHLKSGSVKTILTSGKIKVTANNKNEIIDCNCSAISSSEGIEIEKANLEEALAWKEGYFYFNGRTLLEITQEISRWYDLELDFNTPLNNVRYKGGIKRTENANLVCEVLEKLSGQNIKLKNRKLIIN